MYASHGRFLVNGFSGKGVSWRRASVSLFATRLGESVVFTGLSSLRIFSIEKFRLGLAAVFVMVRFL